MQWERIFANQRSDTMARKQPELKMGKDSK
jgi:hypothetical protein